MTPRVPIKGDEPTRTSIVGGADMLSDSENRRLTQVGPGTPMGELLRRYWMPIAALSELDTRATKPIRLLGEDLVLFRDGHGQLGLIDRRCPHRCADLS